MVFSFSALAKTEMWKGKPPSVDYTAGISAGLAFNGASNLGGTFQASGAIKVIDRGFVPDINDQVFFEVQGGPEFFSSLTVFTGSLHLRWDFHRDEDFTLFATGGLGTRLATGLTQFFPHLGLGAFWRLDVVDIRAEVSHNWLLVGASFPF